MLALHDHFTRQMRNDLKTSVIRLGLVRLLQDARRFEEARATLYSLESDFQGVEVDKPTPSENEGIVTAIDDWAAALP